MGFRFSAVLTSTGHMASAVTPASLGLLVYKLGPATPPQASEGSVRGNALKGSSAVPALGVAAHTDSFFRPLELMLDLGT